VEVTSAGARDATDRKCMRCKWCRRCGNHRRRRSEEGCERGVKLLREWCEWGKGYYRF